VVTLTRRTLLGLGGLAATGLLGAPVSAAPAPARHAGAPTDLELHDPENLLAVVTKQRPLDPVDYAPDDLVPWRDPHYELRSEVAEQLARLVDAAADEGHGLRVVSGYRSYETQAGTYEYWVAHYGREAADATSARPGHSEHQTGLAVDLDNDRGSCYLEPCFGDTVEGRWVARHAHAFGFILSYPAAEQERTGYAYEPWHIRYVGPTVARQMRQRGQPLLQDYLRTRAHWTEWHPGYNRAV
jgi:D-alanyl-D-alanine carboxypeptidase